MLKFFGDKISALLQNYDIQNLEEIRIRANKPIILKFNTYEKVLDYITTQEDILKILQLICNNSIYSFQNQICKRIYNSRRWT